MISAHLDTVFPPGTDVSPQWSGGIVRAPGIADDARGLATLLALGRVLTEVRTPLPFPLLFAATVGEEGQGDLRGVRHLFREDGPGQGAMGFISLDGVGIERVITRGVGSTRLRITLRGPGGHSWADWGLPNPIHQLGQVVSSMGSLPTPDSPKTTATAAKWGGGKSINAIPEQAWVEIDLRSEGPDELSALEAALLQECERVLTGPGQNEKSSHRLELELQELGRRPAGGTETSSPLVDAAVRATRTLGLEPRLTAASTDANIPMSLGIPAITLGAGGEAGGIHTLDEWYSNEKGPEGILRAFLTLVLLR
jgi:acetylornithine deacetylase/succinyl-diaminopimelate desuccinylase-like protein